MATKEITTEEMEFVTKLIKRVLSEYPEINFILYPKRNHGK